MTASPVAAPTVQFNPESRLYINGNLRESSTGKTVDNINPATEEVLETSVGDPTDPANFCGPLVSAKQRDRVLGYIAVAKVQGARVTVGGGKSEDLDRGYFVAPTVLADVAPDHRAFQEEIFGPVITITPYDGGDDGAVEMANNSIYGLAGTVLGSNERAMSAARRIRTGSVNVGSAMFYGADAPFGGYKMSGIGRQNGIEGFGQHLQTKVIAYPLESA